ncbi:MAG: hypothetical protein ACTSVR_04895 [Candidatus Thorarchaeota archaeon]
MASVILDFTTRGLDEAINNVRQARNLVTAGVAPIMVRWYNTHMKKTMLNIIETGEGMADNVGLYARRKQSKYSIYHGLGNMTHMLYFGVSMSQPAIKETRGKELRFSVRFDDPYYIAYVVDGTSAHVGRDFITLARDKDWQVLLDMIGTVFNNLDFTKPYPELLSTVMGANFLPSLRSYD